jgi:uncharacterized protein with HEPN domain
MKHQPSKYLADMLDRCQYVRQLTSGKSMEDYKRDRMFRGAIERELQNIGEALRQLQSRSPDIAKKISEHERIIRFRHALVHGYDMVRADYVWDVIEIKLPVLQKELADLLDQKSFWDGQP